jgi:hypothetical protein
MSAQSPRLAIRGEVARLPLPPLDIEPVSTLFVRHLPPSASATTFEIERDSIRADYVRLLARLNEAVAQAKVHFAYHTLEALCLANLNPAAVRPYIADLGHACYTLEQLISPEASAVDPRKTRMFA